MFKRRSVTVLGLAFVGLVAFSLAAPPARAAVWYVDDDAPNDPAPGDPTLSDPLEDGSAAHPFDAIQEAINASADGDEIVLADGTYTGIGNRDLDYAGRAITVHSANGDATACVIDCEAAGRGFYFHTSEGLDSTLATVTIVNGRTTSASPGGISGQDVLCAGASPTIRGCIFGRVPGVPLRCEAGSTAHIVGCIGMGEGAPFSSGVSCDASSPTIESCTFWRGLTISCSGGSTPVITNSIVNYFMWTSDCNPTITHCLLARSYGDSNVVGTPLLTEDGFLRAGSPGIDAGDSSAGVGEVDISGEPRGNGAGVDIGADEWHDADADGLPDWWETKYFASATAGDPNGDEDDDGRPNIEEYTRGTAPDVAALTQYVAPDGDDAWDGLASAWDGVHGPKQTIQAAVDVLGAARGDTVVLADGKYDAIGSRSVLVIDKPLEIRSASGVPEACIVDCGGRDIGIEFRGPGAHTLAGVTVQNAFVSSSEDGGGVFCDYARLILSHCVFRDNVSRGRAGAVTCYTGAVTLLDCVIAGNSATGLAAIGAQVHMQRCEIVANNADDGPAGGVALSFGSEGTLIDCALRGNVCRGASELYAGSALLCDRTGLVTLTNCEIVGSAVRNFASYQHGTVDLHLSGALQLTNCTVVGNGAGESVFVASGSRTHLTLDNCVVYGNNGPALTSLASNVSIRYSDFQGGWAGDGNIDAAPLFVRSPSDGDDGWGDDLGTPDVDEGANDDFGDLRLLAGSPCIDAGDNAAVPADDFDLDDDGDITEPVPLDFAGRLRFVDDPGTLDSGLGTPPLVDMGAQEFQGPGNGDVNCDGSMDFFDIDPFVLALNGEATYTAYYPDCDWYAADCNGDGRVDFFDIDPFVVLLTQ